MLKRPLAVYPIESYDPYILDMAGFSVEGIHFSLAYSDYVDRELVDTTEVIFFSADIDPQNRLSQAIKNLAFPLSCA